MLTNGRKIQKSTNVSELGLDDTETPYGGDTMNISETTFRVQDYGGEIEAWLAANTFHQAQLDASIPSDMVHLSGSRNRVWGYRVYSQDRLDLSNESLYGVRVA